MKIFLAALRKFLPRRLWHQVLILLVLLMIAPLISVGLLVINFSKSSIKSTLLNDHKQITVYVAKNLNHEIENSRKVLRAYVSFLSILPEEILKQESEWTKILNEYPFFQRMSLLTFKNGLLGRTDENDNFLNDVFKRFLNQEKNKSKPFIEFFWINAREGALLIYEPIKKSGEMKGAILGIIRLKDIMDRVKNNTVGQIIPVAWMGSDVRIIHDSENDTLAQKGKPTYQSLVGHIKKGRAMSIEIVNDINGKRKLLAYAPVGFKGLGIISERPVGQDYHLLEEMKIQIFLVILASLGAAVLISILLAGFLSRIIHALIEGNNRLANGDFSYRFRIRSRDELGKLFFSFNRMAKQLKEGRDVKKLSVLGKAASNIAHELKNSLLLVNTFINMIPKKHKDQEFINEFSETIPKELDYWNKMLKHMMDSSRPEKMAMEYIDINALLTEILALARFKLNQKKIKIRTHFKRNMPSVFGDIEKLKQVFLNLLTNSIEATPKGGWIKIETQYVDINPSWTATFLEIRVSNSGQCLSIVDQERIFEPYYTTKEKGLGMGLSICRDIIKNHGGVIDVLKGLDHGVSFSVQLPINKDLISRNKNK